MSGAVKNTSGMRAKNVPTAKNSIQRRCTSSTASSRSSCNSSSYTEFFLNCVNQFSQFQNRQFLDIFNELQNLFISTINVRRSSLFNGCTAALSCKKLFWSSCVGSPSYSKNADANAIFWLDWPFWRWRSVL